MKTRKIKIAIIISTLFIFMSLSWYLLVNKINDQYKYYNDTRLLSYEITNRQDSDESSTMLNIIFNQDIDITEAQKNIFVAMDLDGINLIDKISIEINPDDLRSVIVKAPEEGYEAGEYYLLIREGFSTKDPGYRPLTETEKIKFTIRNVPYLEKWGLGKNETKSVHLDRPYDWYMSQSNTGKDSSVNCGPTSTTMAIKWVYEDFDKTPEDARKVYRPSGGWWYTDDIKGYLGLNDVKYYEIDLNLIDNLIKELDKGNIAILCLDMSLIRKNISNPEEHVDLYYEPYSGHFIVAKGYRIVDGNLFLETYDPYFGEWEYKDGSYKGKDRYYRAEDIIKATKDWWNHAIIITGD